MSLRTQAQKERAAKHQKIRKMYAQLSENPDNAKTAIEKKIMDKFDIRARSTVWNIVSGQGSVETNLNPRI